MENALFAFVMHLGLYRDNIKLNEIKIQINDPKLEYFERLQQITYQMKI